MKKISINSMNNMNTNNIKGGVSPLKARQASRGGERAGKATRTAKQRGGFARSKGVRGAGGANVGGYNVNTRFKSRAAWTPPASGGTATTPEPQKPYSYTPDGELKMNPGYKLWVDPVLGIEDRTEVTETLKESQSGVEIGSWDYETKGNPTYKQAYKLNLENVRDKFKTEQDYVDHMEKIKAGEIEGASKEDIHKSMYDKKSVFVKGTKGKPGYWQHYDGNGNPTHRTSEKE